MRIVKHALGVFCLLAALLLAGLWVRSYWVGAAFARSWYADEGEHYVYRTERWFIVPGQLFWYRFATGRPMAQGRINEFGPDVPLYYRRLASPSLILDTRWHGFAYLNERDQSEAPYAVHWTRYIAIPIWLPLLIFAAPAGLWLRGVLRRKRGAHECPNCGDDLRASPAAPNAAKVFRACASPAAKFSPCG